MNGFALPLEIESGSFREEKTLKKSIDDNIDMIITTPTGSCVIDPGYGFVFNNLTFEMLSEEEGVVFQGDPGKGQADLMPLYRKKLSGSSKNEDCFAYLLKQAIERDEKRLSEVKTTMTYIRAEKTIHVTVQAVIVQDGTPYKYDTLIQIWK